MGNLINLEKSSTNTLHGLACKIFLGILLIVAIFIPTVSFAAEDKDVVYDIQTYADDMQPGWNLGNTFDGFDTEVDIFDETAWGNPLVTEELINSIAAQGFKSIRIPITFDTRTGEGPDYPIHADFLARAKQAIDWSLDADLKVMINIHHDSWNSIANGMPWDHDNTVARFDSIWNQLSETFKDYPTDLMFESLNEPQFWGEGGDEEGQVFLDELNTSFYDIVRNSGGNNGIRPLVIPTLHTNFEEQIHVDNLNNWIDEIDDPYIIATVHYYGYWPFSVNVAGTTTFDETTKNHIIENFDRVHRDFVAKGIPVVIGEYGLLGFDQHTGTIQQGEKLKFFEFAINYANEKNLVHMLWDNGQHFNRTSLEWNDPELYEIMQASWSGRSATADTNYLYLKQGEAFVDVEKTLNLNGTTFSTLELDGEELVVGQDYQVNGDVLTIKAELLSSLASDQLERSATLTARFDSGSNWYFHVYNYQTPNLESAEGTTSDFEIPVQFNGAELRTMEAVYTDDGSAAGPQSWTTYKEFAYAFNPSYENNVVTFPFGNERFFNEIEDGREVKLTFHFTSGETITYLLRKDGDRVVGFSSTINKIEDLDKNENDDYIVKAPSNSFTIKEDVADNLAEGTSVLLTNGKVTVTIPSSVLKNKGDITFSFGEVSDTIKSNNADALSDLFDFTLTNGDGSVSLDSPVTLSFTVDPTKVGNWDDLKVVFIDEDGVKQEQITPNSFNKETGEVVADVTHFSVYGVFEIASTDPDLDDDDDESNDEGPTDDEDESNGGSQSDNDNESNKEEQSNNDDEVKVVDQSNDKEEIKDVKQASDGNEKLPDTATNQFNWLLIGGLLLIAGIISLIVTRRRLTK